MLASPAGAALATARYPGGMTGFLRFVRGAGLLVLVAIAALIVVGSIAVVGLSLMPETAIGIFSH